MQLPIATVQSGPINSVRGAAALTGLTEALVIDIGGTTTDVGALVSSLPRSAGGTAEIAGVRTNYHLPDLLSIGIALSLPPASLGRPDARVPWLVHSSMHAVVQLNMFNYISCTC